MVDHWGCRCYFPVAGQGRRGNPGRLALVFLALVARVEGLVRHRRRWNVELVDEKVVGDIRHGVLEATDVERSFGEREVAAYNELLAGLDV